MLHAHNSNSRLIQKTISRLTGLALIILAPMAASAPFGAFDARSMAMGGAGVASATIDNAGFFNPAMLAAQKHEDDFAVLIPSVGLRLADPSDLVVDIEDFQVANNAGDVVTAANIVLGALDKTLLVTANAGVSVGFAADNWGMGVMTNAYSWNSVGVRRNFSNILLSEAVLRGVDVVEVGVPIAASFEFAGVRLALGVTPKQVDVTTRDYAELLATLETSAPDFIDINATERGFSTTNADVGAVLGLGQKFRVGLMVRNVQDKQYDTSTGGTIRVEKQPRAGVAYNGDWFTLVADLDLTENDPIAYEQKTQIAALGAEFNVLSLLQLRAGMQRNLADTTVNEDDDLYSLGLGLSPLGVHLDFAAVTNGNENDLGFYFQLGFRF